MSEQTVQQPILRSEADYIREIDRILAEMERLDESISRNQEETRRSRERTEAMLAEMRSK